jgi:Ca2+-transporting ATPase
MRRQDWRRVMIDGLVLAAATLGSYFWTVKGLGLSPEDAVTVSFLTLAVCQLIHVFNLADRDSPFFRSEVVRNPFIWMAVGLCAFLLWLAAHLAPLAEVLGLHAPSANEWLAIAIFGGVPLIWELLRRGVEGLRSIINPRAGKARVAELRQRS